MVTDTLDLVESLTPLAALQQFLANAAAAGVETNELAVLKMTAGAGTQTRLDVALDLNPSDLTNWMYAGVTSIQYNRIDLSDFFQGIPLQFNPPSYPTSTAWLCETIARIGQIQFDPSDFVQETITEEMAIHYILKANPASYRFVGEVPVALFKQVPLVKYFILPGGTTKTSLGSMEDITQDLGVGIYSRTTNGTILVKQLLNLPAGYVFTARAMSPAQSWDLFNRVLNQTSTTWTIDPTGAKPYNGFGAKVIYNGRLNPEWDRPYNTNLDYVCRIQLNSSYCSNTDGVLSIYYSLARLEN